MKFSLVSTCYNEIKGLERWISDVQEQTRRPDEIIIVDACSTDGTTERLLDWSKSDNAVKIILQKSTPAKARNLAVSASRYDNIVSTDFGCRLDACWFEEICRVMEENEKIMVVAGNYRVQEATLTSNAAWADYCLNNFYQIQLREGFLPSNRSIGYKKEVWEKLRGYPEDLKFYGDDAVFALQLYQEGFSVGFAPKAVCFWERHNELKSFWHEQYVYGFGCGEANILPYKYSAYRMNKWYPLLYCFDAFVKTIKRVPGAAYRTLLRRKYLAVLFVPLLIFGNYINYYRGYKDGCARGEDKCRDCRSRLRNASLNKTS
jgi:glycosyltransferase involved in cell wall biosynthesis